MESLVRFLIGFVFINQLLLLGECKVIKQSSGHEKEISEIAGGYEVTHLKSSHASQVELNETSINYPNATRLTASDVNSSTHRIPGENQIVGRSLLKIKKAAYSVKRSFKKIFYAWTYYGPEIGLCSCLFKYAWFTYPVTQEITYAAMGRAKRLVSGFMEDFMTGFAEQRSKDQHHSISEKVAATTADDFYNFQDNEAHSNYGPFRRVSNHDDNVPLVEKTNPQLSSVVELLKNLQPKANVSDFVIRLARHIKNQPRKPNNVQQFRFVSDDGDEIRYFAKQHQRDEAKASVNTTKPINDVVEARSSVGSNDKRAYSYGPPPSGLPSFNELPSADYSYYKQGTYYHVHDLRKDKKPAPVKGGQWLKFDFEEAILSAMGVSHPGRSLKPTVAKCSKIYAFNFVLRCVQTLLLG